MEQHKYILASDTRDILGTWTEPNIIEVQSLPDTSNGARGIVVQGVGMTNSKQKAAGATRSNNKGGPHQSALMEHFTQQHGSAAAAAASAAQVIVAHQMQQAQTEDQDTLAMINTLRPAKTKLGKARIRMKWTTEVNEYILRTYYLITQLETNCKHYRDTLHKLFSEEFPDVEVCAQRIADQRRAIVKNHLLTQERIDEIRREVELDLGSAGGLGPVTQQQQQQQQTQRSVAPTLTSSGSGPIIVSSPIMTMSKEHPSTMTVWYGCVKEEQQDTDGPYHVAGPSSHKLRKLSHGHSIGGGVGGISHHQPQPSQHIIIHTTSAAAAAAAALGVGPHTITSTSTDAPKR